MTASFHNLHAERLGQPTTLHVERLQEVGSSLFSVPFWYRGYGYSSYGLWGV